VNETQVLAALDELIARTAPNDCSALVVALSARLCGLGALSPNAATKRQPQTTAEEPERNPSAKEAAPDVVQQGCPGNPEVAEGRSLVRWRGWRRLCKLRPAIPRTRRAVDASSAVVGGAARRSEAPGPVHGLPPDPQVEAKSASQGDEVDFHWINLKARGPPVWR